jgi:hypothetical protein
MVSQVSPGKTESLEVWACAGARTIKKSAKLKTEARTYLMVFLLCEPFAGADYWVPHTY